MILAVNALFLVNGSVPAVRFLVSENPGMTQALAAASEPVLPYSIPRVHTNNPMAGDAYWNGYIASTSATYDYNWWWVPSVTGSPSGGCGPIWAGNACYLAIWAGQTNQAGGGKQGNPGFGIAQSGSATIEVTYWGGYSANQISWWEFYGASNDNGMVKCNNINPGDLVEAYTEYLGGTYTAYADYVMDYTTNYGCIQTAGNGGGGSFSNSFAMGSPQQSNWIAEQPNNGAAAGEPIPPVSNFWQYGQTSDTTDLTQYNPQPQNYVTQLTTHQMYSPANCKRSPG
ncbi:MAG: hypothetical protein ACYDDF_14945 [Thermoplasmatota archaeon]